MGLSKRTFVMLALKELGVAKNDVDITVDEMLDSTIRLDAMMAGWDSEGLHLSWPITNSSPVDPDVTTLLPPLAIRAVVVNLAVELAPMFGKGSSVTDTTKRVANEAKDRLVSSFATPPRRRLRVGTPLGQGNRRDQTMRAPFVQPVVGNITIGDDSEFDF